MSSPSEPVTVSNIGALLRVNIDPRGMRAAIMLLTILLASILFKLWLTPVEGLGVYSLVPTPDESQRLSELFSVEPLRLFLPQQLDPGRWLWWTTTFPLLFGLYKFLNPLGVYIVLSSLLIATSFVTSWLALRSLVFSGIVAFALGFGSQLAYALTMGNILADYLFLSYVCANLLIAVRLLQAPSLRPGLVAGFIVSLTAVALSMEWWLDYAVCLVVGFGFVGVWERRHNVGQRGAGAAFIVVATLVTLVLYLTIRLRVAAEYVTPGAEEELILTYRSGTLIVEDVVVNFCTYMYMAVANYLPSFFFGSISQTYLGDLTILTGQNGYHPEKTQLVVMSHLFLWRFYAGAMVGFFCLIGAKWLRRALSRPVVEDVVLAGLFLAVITGCGTHLMIKYRPYISAPALGYKAVVSIFFFTLLMAYAAVAARPRFKHEVGYRAALAGLYSMILIGAFTRPAMLNVMLEHVGLQGYGNPLGMLRHLLH
jgi:hypothetical protein